MSNISNTIQIRHAFDLKQFIQVLRENAFPGLWLWALTLALCTADIILADVNPRVSLDLSPMLGAIPPLLFVPVLIWRLSKTTEAENPKYTRMMRIGLTVLYLVPTMAALATFNNVVMAFPAPMVDDVLLRWDQALGLDWVAYASLVGHFNFIIFALDNIYQAMLPALIIVGLHAILIGQSAKCTELLALVMTTGIFVVTIAAFFPAIGPMDHIHDAHVLSLYAGNGISAFLAQLIEVRTAPHVILNPLRLAGLAQFPSFHCVCGIYTIYASRGSYFSLIPATIFSILMIAATPIIGDHYFVDLIAGACIAICFILVGRKIQENYAKA